MNTKEYYESIPFSYLKTYSFHRGPKLEEYLRKKTEEITLTEEAISKARYMELSKLNEQLNKLRKEKELHSNGLFNNQRNIHESAIEVATIRHDSYKTEELRNIFATPIEQQIVSGCIPLYRDAIVFYDHNDEIRHVLDICFECLYLKTDDNTYLEADFSFYTNLALLLKSLGHDITSRPYTA